MKGMTSCSVVASLLQTVCIKRKASEATTTNGHSSGKRVEKVDGDDDEPLRRQHLS